MEKNEKEPQNLFWKRRMAKIKNKIRRKMKERKKGKGERKEGRKERGRTFAFVRGNKEDKVVRDCICY